MRLGTADVLVRAKTDKFDKDIDKSKKKVKNFGESSKKQLASLTSSFASLAGAAGVGALTVSLVGLVSVGTKFESQMATVRGIMRASEKDFKLLSNAAKKMGETTEWSATQSAEALEFMALAGWNVEKSIKGLPGMLDAATAAGARLGETSDILTDTLTAMGLGIEDMDRLTDVMVGTTVRANTSFLQMGEALKESAPYAKAYGFEIEEVSALLGIVADAGIKGSDAGTGLKNTWINNAKAAKILGTEATDLIGTLRAANEAQWDTNQFAKVYGKIAGKTVLNIAAQIPKYEALAKTLHNVKGETKKLADIKLDVVAGDFKILKSAIEGVGLAAYENIKGQLRESLQDMTKFVSDHKQDFVDFAESAKEIGGHLAVIGGQVASLLGNTLRGWNALPTIVQEMGIIGAIVGGVPGRLALIGTVETLGLAVGYIDDLVKSAEGISTVFGKEFKLVEDFEGAEKQLEQLEKLRDEFLELSAVGKKKMGGNIYLERLSEQIDDTVDHLDDLKETISEVEISSIITPKEKKETITPVEIELYTDDWLKREMAVLDSWMKNEEKRLKLEKEINKQIHDELLSGTDFRLQELDAQYLNYLSYVKDQAALDDWYVKKYKEIMGTKEQAYLDMHNKTGIMSQAAYDILYTQYEKDRDDFIRLTGDKKLAQETFIADVNALNEKMEPPEPDLSPILQAYIDLYNNFGILTQEAYDQLYNQYVKDRDEFIALTGDKQTAQELFAQRLNALNKEMETSNKTWMDGAKAGLEDYAKTAMDVIGNVQNAFESGFKGMEDALVDFCMTGKMDFADFASSIIRDMLRIYIQSQITGPLVQGISSLWDKFIPSAHGNVYDSSSSLSAHSNTIVDSPTLFSFAQGRGLMGEAGPEAIMPLTRLPGGDLGVKTESGGNESSKRPMEIHIHEAPGTQTRTEESEDGTRLDVIIEQVEQAMTGRMGRGTGLAPFMDSRYARTY